MTKRSVIAVVNGASSTRSDDRSIDSDSVSTVATASSSSSSFTNKSAQAASEWLSTIKSDSDENDRSREHSVAYETKSNGPKSAESSASVRTAPRQRKSGESKRWMNRRKDRSFGSNIETETSRYHRHHRRRCLYHHRDPLTSRSHEFELIVRPTMEPQPRHRFTIVGGDPTITMNAADATFSTCRRASSIQEMKDAITRRFSWWRVLFILVAILVGWIVICHLINSAIWTNVYHDWWYLREALLNDEFAKRPFMYDVRYFVLNNTEPSSLSPTKSQSYRDESRAFSRDDAKVDSGDSGNTGDRSK